MLIIFKKGNELIFLLKFPCIDIINSKFLKYLYILLNIFIISNVLFLLIPLKPVKCKILIFSVLFKLIIFLLLKFIIFGIIYLNFNKYILGIFNFFKILYEYILFRNNFLNL